MYVECTVQKKQKKKNLLRLLRQCHVMQSDIDHKSSSSRLCMLSQILVLSSCSRSTSRSAFPLAEIEQPALHAPLCKANGTWKVPAPLLPPPLTPNYCPTMLLPSASARCGVHTASRSAARIRHLHDFLARLHTVVQWQRAREMENDGEREQRGE